VTAPGGSTLVSPTQLRTDFEEIYGYFVQATVPLWKKPRWGTRVRGIFVFNRLSRRGPELTLLQNVTVGANTFDSIAAFDFTKGRFTTHINKFTCALNWQMTQHFATKLEYSYWAMGKASTFSPTTDINQSAMSIVMAF
jgi:hypothetical protein